MNKDGRLKTTKNPILDNFDFTVSPATLISSTYMRRKLKMSIKKRKINKIYFKKLKGKNTKFTLMY